MKRTSLSAGLFIPSLLKHGGVNERVYPCAATAETKAPYVVFARKSQTGEPVKGADGADGVVICLWCYHSDYEMSIELAEKVRSSIEGKQASTENLTLRSAVMVNSSEGWVDDSYLQYMEFKLKIN